MEELAQLKQRLAEVRPDPFERLPDIPLYMDQVVSYLARQSVSLDAGDSLTPAMINNYIKDGLLHRANGKKYDQEHLGLLTAITALKQVLSVREMKVLTAVGREGWESKKQYDYFCRYLDESMTAVADQLDPETSDYDLPKLVLKLATQSYASGLACRQVLSILARHTGHEDMLEKK